MCANPRPPLPASPWRSLGSASTTSPPSTWWRRARGRPGVFCRGRSVFSVGDGHKGPLITEENRRFLKNNNEQSSSQTASHATHVRGPRQGRAHSPESLCGPTSSRPPVPLGRTSVSLQEWAPRHETSASLEGLTPLGRVSASLEAAHSPRRRTCSPT
jgi:hypothetical protein